MQKQDQKPLQYNFTPILLRGGPSAAHSGSQRDSGDNPDGAGRARIASAQQVLKLRAVQQRRSQSLK